MDRLKATNIYPKKHMLNNKGSDGFLQHIKQSRIMYEKVLPHMHQHNAAKKSFKNNFITILYGVDKQFPMHLWGHLLPQTEMAVNMLQATNI